MGENNTNQMIRLLRIEKKKVSMIYIMEFFQSLFILKLKMAKKSLQ